MANRTWGGSDPRGIMVDVQHLAEIFCVSIEQVGAWSREVGFPVAAPDGCYWSAEVIHWYTERAVRLRGVH